MNLNLNLMPKITSKWIIDLSIKPKIIKLLEETIGDDTDIGKHLLARKQRALTEKKKITNWT